jgi:hypothetical protein
VHFSNSREFLGTRSLKRTSPTIAATHHWRRVGLPAVHRDLRLL